MKLGLITSIVVGLSLCVGSLTNVAAADAILGAQIYAKHCSSCHGAAGRAIIEGTPDFGGGATTLMKPNSQLASTIRNGSGIMPAFQGILTEGQINNVIAHIRTFF